MAFLTTKDQRPIWIMNSKNILLYENCDSSYFKLEIPLHIDTTNVQLAGWLGAVYFVPIWTSVPEFVSQHICVRFEIVINMIESRIHALHAVWAYNVLCVVYACCCSVCNVCTVHCEYIFKLLCRNWIASHLGIQ